MDTTKREALALIAKAYTALEFLDGITFTHYRSKCFEMAEAEEKDHRSSFREFGWGITRKDAAKLFVVQRIAQCLDIKNAPPAVVDILRFQPSYMYAAAIAAKYGQDIRSAFTLAGVTITQLAALDYAKLVETRAHKVAA
jgi:hypothetical protein